jgi:hypothetical protein
MEAQALAEAKKQADVADALWTGDLLVSVAKTDLRANAFAERLCPAQDRRARLKGMLATAPENLPGGRAEWPAA